MQDSKSPTWWKRIVIRQQSRTLSGSPPYDRSSFSIARAHGFTLMPCELSATAVEESAAASSSSDAEMSVETTRPLLSFANACALAFRKGAADWACLYKVSKFTVPCPESMAQSANRRTCFHEQPPANRPSAPRWASNDEGCLTGDFAHFSRHLAVRRLRRFIANTSVSRFRTSFQNSSFAFRSCLTSSPFTNARTLMRMACIVNTTQKQDSERMAMVKAAFGDVDDRTYALNPTRTLHVKKPMSIR
mmetsp:Transcript_54466/g.143870  ORF Transcript_54466/g.143870 Transcript_54466/m.143870 type:complete len:247 (-) Transcript_54466:779-1519(-)